jgi:endonuclease YncB( thermonuclease family)
MTQNTYQIADFEKLASDLKDLIISRKNWTQSLVKQQTILTYWEVGQRIEEEGLTQNAGLKSSILQDLSFKLEIDRTTLIRSIQFFEAYPNKDELESLDQNLSWSHYKYLVGVKDPDLRLELTQKAKENNWSLSELSNEGNDLRQKAQNQNKKIKELKRPTNMDYTYRAEILNVIDGDTILANIDLGFNVNKEQRIRLSGINAKEMDTPKGKEAHFYLRSLLANTNNVIIKTNKVDIYGRFVADIFYLEEETKNKRRASSIFKNGIYLNAHLFKKDLVDLF